MRKTSNSFSKQNSQQPKVFRGGEKKVMKKSLLSLALAGSMLSALAVPAFAATPSDVVGKPVQTAVEQLTALGILQGYADGTFKPDNTITRAELAKIVVIATGNQNAATLMQTVKPTFKDVKANVWYTGFINVAATKGFIQGYNGNFRPNDTIKFEEVVAILVRALGYEDKRLSGSWPYNVLLQADEIGLFEGVEIAKGTNASRGVVAELTSNVLGENLVTYNVDNEIYVPGKQLISKVGVSKDAIVTAAALDKDGKLQIVINGDATPTFATPDANFFITNGQKLADLLGHSVNVLFTKDGKKVLAVSDTQSASSIITKTAATGTKFEAGKKFTVDGTEYTAAGDLVVYHNSDSRGATATLASASEVQLIKNGDGLVQAVLINEWNADATLKNVEAYSNYSRINTKTDGVDAGGSYKVDATTAITLDGKPATIADLKENDIVNVLVNDAKLATKVVATRKTVAGKLQSVSTNSANETIYKVNGTNYVAIEKTKLTGSAIGDTEYTFYLNKDGKVAYHSSATAATGDFQVIYDVDNNLVDTDGDPATAPVAQYYSIIKDGEVASGYSKVVYYNLKDQKKYTVYAPKALNLSQTALDHTLAKVEFESNGIVKSITESTDYTGGKTVKAVTASKLTLDLGNNAEDNYILNSNTVYLSVNVNGTDSTVKAATAADVGKGDVVKVKADAAGNAQYVIITSDGDSAELPTVQGVFVSKAVVATSATDKAYSVTLNVKGEEKTFAVSVDIYNKVAANEVVTLKDVNSANAEYDDATNTAVAPLTGVATSLTVNSDTRVITTNVDDFVVTGDTQIFSVKKDLSGLATSNFSEVKDAGDDYYKVGNEDGYQVVVVASGQTIGGNPEAGVIVIINNK
ncbi:S-layer homology domain-containing protein [Paenibacillus glycanilyticus]|uniref:S-layer homology domain-containing protein n=1 Tax=Paenibacillus glycanilyticus TaxID=126569 RepID=UPI001910A544|nr:S-layer homology domain-containing protein [Paenibacillus glycanilyticus]